MTRGDTTRADVAAVRLRVVWVAARDGGRQGRVVVQRTVSGEAGPSGFWMSGSMAPAALVGVTGGGHAAAWDDLLLGLPVGELATPVAMRPAAPSDLGRLSEELAGSDAVAVVQRPLLLADAELVAGAAISARVVRFSGDVLAHAFDGVLDGPPPGLVLGKTTVEGTAAAAHEAGTRTALDAWIPLGDLTAARPLGYRGRATTLLLELPPDVALASPLDDAEVRARVVSVAAAPDDAAAREALVAALTRAGWGVDAEVASVDVGSTDADELVGRLDGLVVLAGRGPDGAHRVTLVGPTPAASAVLRSHERLAAALADHLAPPPDTGGAAARIGRRRELRAALRAAAAGWDEPA